VKAILSVVTVFSLLAAAGCVTSNRGSARALVRVESAAAFQLHSQSSVEKKSERDFALGKVLARAESPGFRAAVAESQGVSPEKMQAVTVWGVPQTGMLEVKAESPDRALATRLVNAVAQSLAEEYRANPDIHVTVIRLARLPITSEEME
jgi:hypothetical protein